ncbi:MAG: adenylate kinase family protein [Promethearchaeota archaeon]
MKTIIISGTPGTGKTTFAKKLNEILPKSIVITLNDLILRKKFYLGYDNTRQTYIADIDKLIPYLIRKLKEYKEKGLKYLIIEGHFSEIIPSEYINFAIVLRCHPEILKKRLLRRNYNQKKIIENVQAEILGNCANNLIEKEMNIPIYEFDTSKRSIEDLAKTIVELINEKGDFDKYKVGHIDWLEDLFINNKLEDYFPY